MKASADTNILVYASGENDPHRQLIATKVIEAMFAIGGVLTVQSLAELHRVLTRKFRRPSGVVERELAHWSTIFEIAPTSLRCLSTAASLVTHHNLQIFDAIIIAASSEAGCRVLFSEDMQHGAVFNGVTIVNPFAEQQHPLLLAVMKSRI